MAVYEIRPATDEDMVFIAEHARQADIDELWAADRITPLETMRKGARVGEAFLGLVDGCPVCVFGVAPISFLTGTGIPWMVGTTLLDKHAAGFVKGSRFAIRQILRKWGKLYNMVDARNTRAIRWLKWLGFQIYPSVPYGHLDLPFHPFLMEAKHV